MLGVFMEKQFSNITLPKEFLSLLRRDIKSVYTARVTDCLQIDDLLSRNDMFTHVREPDGGTHVFSEGA